LLLLLLQAWFAVRGRAGGKRGADVLPRPPTMEESQHSERPAYRDRPITAPAGRGRDT
jgi:hypothetical protein